MTCKDVLVVDDDPDLVEIMLFLLREAGYAARAASNGKQALEEVSARIPGLVLLDMHMPVMDGWQCARELRSRYGSTIPIIVITAAEHARRCGDEIAADDVVAKPFDPDQLVAVVDRIAAEPGLGASRR